jgi:hypothetical protein
MTVPTRPRLLDEATSGLGGNMPPRISIDSNVFTLINPSGATTLVPSLPEGPALDVVFVDANPVVSKIYWGQGYQGRAATKAPPRCFSDNGTAPSIAALDPQSPTCAPCPHNVVGSMISPFSGAKIKACQDFKKLAVIVRGYPGVYQLTIKPGSFRNFTGYKNYLLLQKLPDGGAPDLCDVITRCTFASQGVLSFEAISLLPSDMKTYRDRVWEQSGTELIVGKTDQPIAPQLAASRPAGVAPPPPAERVGLPPQTMRQALTPDDPGPIPAALQREPVVAPVRPPNLPAGFPFTQPTAGVAPWDQPQAAQPPAEAAPKRHRRTKAEMEAARGEAARAAERSEQQQTIAETSSPQHGLVEPDPPTPEMLSRLGAAFNLPTK